MEPLSNYRHIYTDGSRGAAAVSDGRAMSSSTGIVKSATKNCIMLIYSRSALAALENREHENPVV